MNDITIRYVDKSTYDIIGHDLNTIYIVSYESEIGIYYQDKEVTNKVECSELPQTDDAILGCFYLLKTDSKLCLYYFYEKEEIKQFIPLFDSTIKDINIVSDKITIQSLLGNRIILGVNSDNLITPKTILDQIVEEVGVIDARPVWRLWE